MKLRVLALLALSACVAAEARPNAQNEIPIVAAVHDLAIGTRVTFDDIVQREIPAELFTTSIVKPDSASYIVNQTLQLPVLTGDPMLWSFFEASNDHASVEACAEAVHETGNAADQVGRARALALESSGP
jgi:Flp pilus assembly protein CpaB